MLLLIYRSKVFVCCFKKYPLKQYGYFKMQWGGLLLGFASLLMGCGLSFSVAAFISEDNSLPVGLGRLKEIDHAYYQYFPCHGLNCHRSVKGCRLIYRSAVSESVSHWFFQCTATMQFLRPVEAVKRWQIEKRGGELSTKVKNLSLSSVQSRIAAISKTTADSALLPLAGQSQSMVTGKFRRYVSDVRQYTFRTIKTGVISKVNSTPGHLFYVKSRQGFVPVTDVASRDKLITASGEQVVLLCHPGQKKHCGVPINSGLPVPVFNFEVYRRHVYFVGDTAVTVHNLCGNDLNRAFGDMDVESLSSEENTFNSLLLQPPRNSRNSRAPGVQQIPGAPGFQQIPKAKLMPRAKRPPLIDPIEYKRVSYKRALRLVSVDIRGKMKEELGSYGYSLESLQQLRSNNMLNISPITRKQLVCFRDYDGNFYAFSDIPKMVFYKRKYLVLREEILSPVNDVGLSLQQDVLFFSKTTMCLFGLYCAFFVFSHFFL